LVVLASGTGISTTILDLMAEMRIDFDP